MCNGLALAARAMLTEGMGLVNTLYLTGFSAPTFVQKYNSLTLPVWLES